MAADSIPDTGCIDPGVEGCTGCFDLVLMTCAWIVVGALLVKRWTKR